MRIDISKIPASKQFEVEEEIVFDENKFQPHRPLLKVLKCVANVKIQKFEDFIYATLGISSKVVLECSYTLQPFETTIKGEEELHFAQYIDDEDEDLIAIKGNAIDFDEFAFNLLSASIPISPKAPNAKKPVEGKGYRVISDEDLFKEKKEQGNSKFDCLKDLEFDD